MNVGFLLASGSVDWIAIVNAMALAFIAFMQVWTKRDAKAASDEQKMAIAESVKRVEVVHALVNSGRGDTLLAGAISARTLANVTGSPEHKALATMAEAKYAEHQRQQQTADKVESKPS